MAQTAEPPAKKIGPEDIEPLFNDRTELGMPVFTAQNVADVLVDRHPDISELNSETVRTHLNNMVEEQGYAVAKFKLGPRTVVYGRPDDPDRVCSYEAGIGLPVDFSYIPDGLKAIRRRLPI